MMRTAAYDASTFTVALPQPSVLIFRERTILLFTAKASAGAGGGAGQAGQDAQRAQEVHVLRCSEAFRHFEASQGRPWAFVSRGWERKKGRPQAPCDPWGGHVSQRRASRPLRATAATAAVPSRASKANQDFWSWETPLLQPSPQFYVGSTRHLL